MELLLTIAEVVGAVEIVILLAATGYGVYLWLRGILPALIRLGGGLAARKIAVFAKNDNLASLVNLLLDSKLFKEKNIWTITKKEDLGRAERASVYLVLWRDWEEEIEDILAKKPDSCALIVYAPPDGGRIPNETMNRLEGTRNTAVANFRGRLLNDVVTAMITTSYETR